MEILEFVHDGAAVVQVSGTVNSANAPELADQLNGLIAHDCRALVVDLSHLEHMTSAGFRSLLRADKAMRAGGGRMVLCGLHGLTQDLFRIGGFLEVFALADTRDAAVRMATHPA